MNGIMRFANRLSKYSAFYIMEAGYVRGAINALYHKRYGEAAGIIAVGAACTAFATLIIKTDKNLENKL